MKTMRHNHGKISEHFNGIGTVTREAVVERAREIALINGRGPNHYTPDDFAQAKRELTGADIVAESQDDADATSELTAWDEPPTESGVPAAKVSPQDEQSYAEELVEEGIEEAEHDQMVEGARQPRNQE